MQPTEVVEPRLSKTTGKGSKKSLGCASEKRKAFDYGGELIHEGRVGPQKPSIPGRGRQRGIPVQQCKRANRALFTPVRLRLGNERNQLRLRHYLPDSPRPLWNHRPVCWRRRGRNRCQDHRRLTFTVRLDFWAASALDVIEHLGRAIVTQPAYLARKSMATSCSKGISASTPGRRHRVLRSGRVPGECNKRPLVHLLLLYNTKPTTERR